MKHPKGELALQTLAMPANTNPNGDIFGGWVVSQMDLAAGIVAKKIAQGRVVTVAIHSMAFLKPVHVGDLVSCYVHPVKRGTTSITLDVEVWVRTAEQGTLSQVTEGVFVFVAVNTAGRPRPL
jgi:acyl-CoA thioesterase YciA